MFFSLSMGLSPLVETIPTSGKVGARVLILGTVGTTNATSRLTIPAAFDAVSDTGTVQVAGSVAPSPPMHRAE